MITGLLPRALSRVAGALMLAVVVGFGWVVETQAATLTGVRHSSSAERTRVVIDLSAKAQFTHRALSEPPRVVVDLPDGQIDAAARARSIGNGFVKQIRLTDLRSGRVQVVVDLERALDYSIFTLDKPDRIVVDIKHPAGAAKKIPEPEPAVEKDTSPKESVKKEQDDAKKVDKKPEAEKKEAAQKTESPPPPSVKKTRESPPKPATPRRKVPPHSLEENRPQHDQWIIAIDAGHGGEDSGARYHDTSEKDITLALAKALKKELEQKEGVKAILVRKGDYFIPLRRRWTLAEKQGANLFVSLHCNASKNRKAQGTEVFFLSLKGATDQATQELANRENAVDEKMGVNVPEDDIDEILFDMMQTDVLAKSEMLAEVSLDQLFDVGTVYGRGVKQAGFAVLKSPRMPSVLVEAAFLSNRKENKMLRNDDWRKKFSRHLADGIVSYIRNVDPGIKAER